MDSEGWMALALLFAVMLVAAVCGGFYERHLWKDRVARGAFMAIDDRGYKCMEVE